MLKRAIARLVERITGRKCCRCYYNIDGRCTHPADGMYMRCWHGITRPGFVSRTGPSAAFALNEQERHELGLIVAALQEAQETARDGGLLGDEE